MAIGLYKVKATHQGQSKISTSLQILCNLYSLQVGGLHSTEMLLVRIARTAQWERLNVPGSDFREPFQRDYF